MFVGVLLLLLGALMLMDKFGLLRGDAWDYFWPLAVIALGVSLVFDSTRKKKRQ
jgi:uncharacterized membrane protein HdeD (DUF308 family)